MTPIPTRMAHLPLDARGLPVPHFASMIDGVATPSVPDVAKLAPALRNKLCWCCGEKLGQHLAFVGGTVMSISRGCGDPPSHLECCEYAARVCPFLSSPNLTEAKASPSVICVYVTKACRPFTTKDKRGQGFMVELGPPEQILWFSRGREATREEVRESVHGQFGALLRSAEGDQRAIAEIGKRIEAVELMFPQQRIALA